MPKPVKSAFDDAYAHIIRRLVDRRLELGMTQADLGTAFGEDQSFMSKVERLQRRVDVYEFVRFCRILKVRPGEILDDLS